LFYGITASSEREWVTLGSGSHMTFWEEPAKYFQIVSDFLIDAAVCGRAGYGGALVR
jgi:pimeloyl-ACP methyl ester carboxylesterase